MGKIGLLVAALALGCVNQVRPVDPTCQDNYPDIRDDVYDKWLEVGIETPTCYSLTFLQGVEFQAACQGHVADGCSLRYAKEIYVRSDLEYERQLVVILHEIGHLAAVSKGHLKCMVKPGDDIMCSSGAPNGSTPTLRDAAFVKGLLSGSETE